MPNPDRSDDQETDTGTDEQDAERLIDATPDRLAWVAVQGGAPRQDPSES